MNLNNDPPALDGLAKVRLVHAQGYSFLFVDHILLKRSMKWLQPKNFVLTMVVKTEDDLCGRVGIDLEGGANVWIDFSDASSPQQLLDHSWLYDCTVSSDEDVEARASGTWRFGGRGIPQLCLYHHTTVDAASSIRNSGTFWSSPWNIQGNKRLKNVAYTYFTDLPQIRNAADLAAIAMSPTKALYCIRDGVPLPRTVPRNWKDGPLANDILELPVYWSSPEKRDVALAVYVDVDLLAPVHVLRHQTNTVWYEVVLPSVYRVGMAPGTVVNFNGDHLLPPASPTRFDYHVIGDATTLVGLAAPFEEENTTHLFKVEDSGLSPLEYWVAHANSDQFSNRPLRLQEFED